MEEKMHKKLYQTPQNYICISNEHLKIQTLINNFSYYTEHTQICNCFVYMYT